MARISNLDFYAILGVHPNAEDIVIRAAFKALAQRYHPDRFNGAKDEAHRRMADLTNAYETLADPARRRKYDRRRGLSARQARFYFKNPERERYPPFTAFALRAAARKAQYYRNAVFVLMGVVVILSAFNVHQHAAQIRELFTWNRPVAGTISSVTPDAAATTAAPSPASADGAAATTATNVRVMPITQGATRAIVPSVSDPQPALAAPDAAAEAPPITAPPVTASPASTPPGAAQAPAPSPVTAPPVASSVPVTAAPAAAPSPVSTPPSAAPAPVTAPPVAVSPPVAAPPVTAPPVAVSPPVSSPEAAHPPARPATVEPQKAAGVAPKEAKHPASPKPATAKAAERERPAARPSAADGDRCTPELIALGLCNRSSTAKGQ